jgi:hypothetical protein
LGVTVAAAPTMVAIAAPLEGTITATDRSLVIAVVPPVAAAAETIAASH